MQLRNDESEITYEVTVKGEDGSQTVDCVLRNFFQDGVDGKDLGIRKDFPLPGGLRHASKEKILEGIYNQVRLEALHYEEKAGKSGDEKEKETLLTLAQELKNLDYDKLQKSVKREK